MIPTPHQTFFRGRYALRAILSALGIGPGSTVALQAFTCYAVPLPVLTLGAKPLYIDADPRTLSMDVDDLARRIDDATAAIVVQHTFGIPGDVEAVLRIASKRGIPVIEDCCHGAASTVEGRNIGSLGIASFFSYEWGKPVVAGVGGGAVLNDPELARRVRALGRELSSPDLKRRMLLRAQFVAFARLLPWVGYWRLRSWYRRLSAMGLIVGTFQEQDFDIHDGPESVWSMGPAEVARLARLLSEAEAVAVHHRRMQDRLTEALQTVGLSVWSDRPGTRSVLLRYPLRSLEKARLVEQAQRHTVELSDIFATPIHPLPSSQWEAVGYRKGECPVAERLAREVVSLPMGVRVDEGDVDRAVEFLSTRRDLVDPAGLGGDGDEP